MKSLLKSCTVLASVLSMTTAAVAQAISADPALAARLGALRTLRALAREAVPLAPDPGQPMRRHQGLRANDLTLQQRNHRHQPPLVELKAGHCHAGFTRSFDHTEDY